MNFHSVCVQDDTEKGKARLLSLMLVERPAPYRWVKDVQITLVSWGGSWAYCEIVVQIVDRKGHVP